MSRRPVGDRLVMSPMDALAAGRAAEALEHAGVKSVSWEHPQRERP
jgi:hypothetical protein